MICKNCGRNVYRNWDRIARDYGNTYRHPSHEFSTCARVEPVKARTS